MSMPACARCRPRRTPHKVTARSERELGREGSVVSVRAACLPACRPACCSKPQSHSPAPRSFACCCRRRCYQPAPEHRSPSPYVCPRTTDPSIDWRGGRVGGWRPLPLLLLLLVVYRQTDGRVRMRAAPIAVLSCRLGPPTRPAHDTTRPIAGHKLTGLPLSNYHSIDSMKCLNRPPQPRQPSPCDASSAMPEQRAARNGLGLSESDIAGGGRVHAGLSREWLPFQQPPTDGAAPPAPD